jgi:LPS-assembly lipoprotein
LFKALSWLIAAIALSSCGYHLRGAADVPSQMQRTYIATDDRHSQFYQVLRTELKRSGIELVDSPADATAIFSIYNDVTDQRVLSVSARNVPTEYEVFYSVSYSVESGQKSLLNRRTQSKVQDYRWDETLVLGKEQEQQQLRNAIVDDLVRVVMIQLSSL